MSTMCGPSFGFKFPQQFQFKESNHQKFAILMTSIFLYEEKNDTALSFSKYGAKFLEWGVMGASTIMWSELG